MKAFVDTMKYGGPTPILFQEIVEVTNDPIAN